MKNFEEFLKENIDPKSKHKTLLNFDEDDQKSDGKEFDNIIDTEDDDKDDN